MKKVLITGSSGFIGTNLVDYLASRNYDVIATDKKQPRKSEHSSLFAQIDLLNSSALKDLIKDIQPEFIVHLGARTDLRGISIDDYAANTAGVSNLIAAANSIDSVKRIIFSSSRLVCKIDYTPKHDTDFFPTTPYGESKVEGEKIVRNSTINADWCIVRPTSIWGPWFEIPYRTFFNIVEKGLYFHPKDSNIFKSFGYVGNTVYQIEKLLTVDPELIRNQTFYLADYDPLNVLNFAQCIQSEFPKSARVKTLSPRLLKFIAKAGDAMMLLGVKNPPLTTFRLNNLVTEMIFDMTRLSQTIGPELPFTMEQGVRETANWIKESR